MDASSKQAECNDSNSPGNSHRDGSHTGRKGWKKRFFNDAGSTSAPAEVAPEMPSNPKSAPAPPPRLTLAEKKQRAYWYSFDKLFDEYVRYLEAWTESDREITGLHADLKAAHEANAELKSQLLKQDKDVRTAQETAFSLMASNVPKAEDDDTIRSKLGRVKSQWKMFSKDWAVKKLEDISDRDGPSVKMMFVPLIASDEDSAPDGIWTPRNRGRAPSILLNTYLARFIAEWIISKPFTAAFDFRSGTDETPTDPYVLVNALGALYDATKTDDGSTVVMAHQWRSQTVELIDPQHGDGHKDAHRRKEDYYRHLVTIFEQSPAQLLYRECDEAGRTERRKHLTEVFSSTGHFFSKLWAQKNNIRTMGLRELAKEGFDSRHESYEAHAAHRLDEGDQTMDGMPIQMVVEPAIIADGNERGEAYGSLKVWAKAVVWISSGGRSGPVSGPVSGSGSGSGLGSASGSAVGPGSGKTELAMRATEAHGG